MALSDLSLQMLPVPKNPILEYHWSLLALMGIFACLGHLFLILSLKYADASKLAPFGYFEIVTNVILGYYFFGDFPHYWTWVGLAIIICSGIYISLRERSDVLIK